ncbi:DUF4224 domain-containing protein [Pseudomonas oryzihabitans]|uniref:DUF4224 domain-containing protein n=1 Tax=Pseudomonas oryzihabitans TaxID=47885 RepID=A0A1G5MUV0_9PSED|nr:DUF4224 domain-containing protein [Pseudomonas psychrotolerans]NMY89778.1 DUF4224 domain-containing protein [Pseudomonas psychrotolerans]SCZ28594.1 protein of unknown function [Pseudomonas psychrotolerans]
MPEVSEFLDGQELATMIGRKQARAQRAWLDSHGWRYEINAAGRPVVGRVYARLKLAGVRPNAANAATETWALDLSKVS